VADVASAGSYKADFGRFAAEFAENGYEVEE
jgi:hypothetical protein